MKPRPTIFVCTPYGGPEWRWVALHFAGEQLDWSFHVRKPSGVLQTRIRKPDLALIQTCRRCIDTLAGTPSPLLVTLDPRATYWCSHFATKRGLSIRHLAYGFNFASLPTGLKRRSMTRAFAHVERFIVYSNFERELYARHFDLSLRSFEMKHWGVAAPGTTHTESPRSEGDYICALGGNRRDYRSLMAAMRSLPDIRCIAAMRPENLRGLEVPSNVKIVTDVPFGEAMDLLAGSRFMVLPLEDAQTPCGHVTIVAAMHFSKATIVTLSEGIADYVLEGRTGLTCEPGNPASIAAKIRQLWESPDEAGILGRQAKAFADEHCTEKSMADHFRGLLQKMGFLNVVEPALA